MIASKLAVSPAGAAELASVSERRIWEEIAAGRLRSFKLGKRRLVRVADLDAFLERRALLANVPQAPRSQPTRRDSSADNGLVVPFPDLEPQTAGAASSAAARGRSATKKKGALSSH